LFVVLLAVASVSLGALALQERRNEHELLQHLASQASLILRNLQLTAQLRAKIDELRASLRRLVEAQDVDRRRGAAANHRAQYSAPCWSSSLRTPVASG